MNVSAVFVAILTPLAISNAVIYFVSDASSVINLAAAITCGLAAVLHAAMWLENRRDENVARRWGMRL